MKISDSSSDSVRNLFNLNKNEKIFDDFGCSLVEKINLIGRIYLTENNICFDSNVFTQIKLKFPINEILELKKNKNTIEFKVKKQKKDIYKFTSFNNFKISYQRIKSICKNFLIKNKKKNFNILLSEDEEDDESSDNEISNNNNNINNINNDNNNNIKNDNNNDINNNINNDNNDNNNNNEIKNDLINKKNSNNLEENVSSKNLNENFKKSNSLNNNIKDEIPKDFKFNELDPSYKFQFSKYIINLSLENFYEKYLTNNPESSYGAFYQSLSDHFDINISNWEDEKDDEKKKSRILDFKIKLTGVPFINQSHVTKKQILIKTPELITISGTSNNSGIPYSDYFEICEIQEFYSFGPNQTVFNMVSKVNFLKSTMLKGTFEKTTKKQYENEIKSWIEFIKKNGEKVEIFNLDEINKKKSQSFENKSLSHGLEKVGYYNNNNNNNENFDIKEIILNYIFQDLKKEFINNINTKNIFIFFIFFFLFIIIFKQFKEINLLKQNLLEIHSIKKNLEEMKILIQNLKK